MVGSGGAVSEVEPAGRGKWLELTSMISGEIRQGGSPAGSFIFYSFSIHYISLIIIHSYNFSVISKIYQGSSSASSGRMKRKVE